jgi:ribose transport system substrate-binding protein
MNYSTKISSIGLALLGLVFSEPSRAAAPVIALSNGYYGNTWRHQMVESFESVAQEAKKQGLISDYVVLNGDGSVNQQMSEMTDLILKHVNVIAMDAASETALNGIIAKACAAGITVIAFDSIVSAPCAYKLNFDFKGYQAEMADWIAKKIGGHGNMLVVRGVKGSAPDEEQYSAQMSVLAKYPDIKVVTTVYGQGTGSVAQSAVANVLPSLPTVNAVLDQGGGDDYGIAQAFEQFGGPYAAKPPVIAGGGSADFIRWWADEEKKDGYSTISMNSTPGVGGAVVWLALDILGGAKASRNMIMPAMKVTNENLKDFTNMKPGTIVSPTYSKEWVEKNLLGQK